MITNHFSTLRKILEVGADLGMLSSYLRLLGRNVTTLEPCTGGFDFFAETQRVVLEEIKTNLQFQLSGRKNYAREHGTFEFIFSLNVLEHIPDLAGAVLSV